MANTFAKCTNFGNCQKADSGELIPVPDGMSLLCPVCQRPLTVVSQGRSRSPVGIIALVVIALAILAFVGLKLMRPAKPTPGGGASSGSTAPDTSSGTASANSTPALNPGDVLMYYERSDEAWLKSAADDFNKQHAGQPQIVLDFRGSREGKQDILYSRGQPVIWNPADLYWIDKLNLDWRSVGKHDSDVVSDSKTILSTRYVIVMWSDRAKVFSSAMQEPQFRGKTWLLLHTLATSGWSSIGGPQSWGKLKLAQSDPTKSNGGMVTLALMYAEYRRDHPEAKTSSSDFLAFMRAIENCVPRFEVTTSKGIDSMVHGGEDQYDGALVYEANALTAVNKGMTNVQIIYPDPTVEIDFPAAIVEAPWTTSDEKQLADNFVTYLVSREVQASAIQYGLRPGIDTMRSNVDDAFSSGPCGAAGFQLDPVTVSRPVGTRLIDDLLYQWNKIYGTQ